MNECTAGASHRTDLATHQHLEEGCEQVDAPNCIQSVWAVASASCLEWYTLAHMQLDNPTENT